MQSALVSVSSFTDTQHRVLRVSALLVLGLSLGACAVPPQRTYYEEAPPEPSPAQVYVYPNQGQSEAQLDRDRYECHGWAVKQTGFDPSHAVSRAGRVQVVSGAPGVNTAQGAVAGAIIGSVVAGPRDGLGGAIFGAIAGAAIGSSVDAANADAAARAQSEADRSAEYSSAGRYRRAISACLEGRGYTVK